MEIKYIITRPLKNSECKENGKIRIIVLKGDDDAAVDYTCPKAVFLRRKESRGKNLSRRDATIVIF